MAFPIPQLLRSQRTKWRYFCALLLLAANSAHPSSRFEFLGEVVAIQDGDTLTVISNRKSIKVRLSEIDAPEAKQPFGERSKQSLAELCFRKTAKVQSIGFDRYKRLIGQVWCNGVDANAMQVERGMSWVYDKYSNPTSPLYQLQHAAKQTKRGLWADSRPIEPWNWRAHRKG